MVGAVTKVMPIADQGVKAVAQVLDRGWGRAMLVAGRVQPKALPAAFVPTTHLEKASSLSIACTWDYVLVMRH